MALSSKGKLLASFMAGAIMTGGIAVATTTNQPITKVCVANNTKAIYFTADGTCGRNRTLMEIGSPANGSGVPSRLLQQKSRQKLSLLLSRHLVEVELDQEQSFEAQLQRVLSSQTTT